MSSWNRLQLQAQSSFEAAEKSPGVVGAQKRVVGAKKGLKKGSWCQNRPPKRVVSGKKAPQGVVGAKKGSWC